MKRVYIQRLAHLGKEKDSFQVNRVVISEHLTLSDNYESTYKTIAEYVK